MTYYQQEKYLHTFLVHLLESGKEEALATLIVEIIMRISFLKEILIDLIIKDPSNQILSLKEDFDYKTYKTKEKCYE